MADNVAITAGSGTTILADRVGLNGTSGLAQFVKIIDATDNGTSRLLVTNGKIGVNAAKSGAWSTTISNTSLAVTKSGTWGLTVTGTVSAAKSGTWGMTVSGTVAATKSGTWGLTVTGTVSAAKSGTWGMTVSGTVAATKSGTWSTTVTQGAASSLNAQVVGSVAHAGTTVVKPVVIGGRARTTLTAATLAATHAVVNAVHDLDGVLIARPYIPLGNILSEYVSATTGASTAFSTFTATTLLRNYITSVIVTNSGATGITIDLRNGTGGSVLAKIPCPTASAALKGGATISFPVPLRQTNTNTALAYDASASLGSGYTITLVGFQSKL